MERELKLVVDGKEALAALAQADPLAGLALAERPLRAIYYDTAERHLQRSGLSLRVRHDGTGYTQTVKADGPAAAGLFVRPEWERRIEEPTPVLDAAAGPILAVIGDRRLGPSFETDIRRLTGIVTWGQARVEVALDNGTINAGEASEAVVEFELELKEGPVSALFGLARALAQQVSVRIGVRTKSERGQDLAERRNSAARKAEPVRLDRDGTVAEAFVAIAGNCLRQFRLNEDLLQTAADTAPALHQARVGLRRLRSAFSLFKPLFAGDPDAARLAAALKALAAVLGDVRDLDVLLANASDADAPILHNARAAAFDRARARLDEAETRALMLDLVEWLAIGQWRVQPADPELANGPIVPFAAHLLDRARKRVKRRGAHLAKLSDDARHEVRIEGKKLRYASEFFAGLWAGAKARARAEAFAEAVEGLQEQLGDLNDRAHGAAVLERLGLGAPPAEPIGRKDLKRAEKALDSLIESKRFWR